ncbi:MAG: DUF4386 domain-containing protein [Chitinophagaceae bacterium]|nr:DUF4386 domain-containing protein [Chitinophagaceae bacterium]
MTTLTTTINDKKLARTAGLLYLLIIACGLFAGVVRQQVLVPGDAASTAQNILQSEGLFRMSFIADMIMALCDVSIGVVFYLLLKQVSKGLAMLAAFLRLAQTAIIGLNLLHHFSAIIWLNNPIYMETMGADAVYAQVMNALELHNYGYLISGVFFGVSCLVLGRLFIKSPLFPTTFGYMLLIAGSGYLFNCYTNFAAPSLNSISEPVMLAVSITTELALCIWLLIKGVKTQKA